MKLVVNFYRNEKSVSSKRMNDALLPSFQLIIMLVFFNDLLWSWISFLKSEC